MNASDDLRGLVSTWLRGRQVRKQQSLRPPSHGGAGLVQRDFWGRQDLIWAWEEGHIPGTGSRAGLDFKRYKTPAWELTFILLTSTECLLSARPCAGRWNCGHESSFSGRLQSGGETEKFQILAAQLGSVRSKGGALNPGWERGGSAKASQRRLSLSWVFKVKWKFAGGKWGGGVTPREEGKQEARKGTAKRSLRSHDNEIWHGMLGEILVQKRDIR